MSLHVASKMFTGVRFSCIHTLYVTTRNKGSLIAVAVVAVVASEFGACDLIGLC